MQQDYILRIVQQFSGFLVRVMRLQKRGRRTKRWLSGRWLRALVGLPEFLVYASSDDDLSRCSGHKVGSIWNDVWDWRTAPRRGARL